MNKTYIKSLAVAAAAFGILCTSTLPVFAQDTTTGEGITKSSPKSFEEQKCKAITTRVANKITKFDENKDNHIKRYTNIKNRIAAFVTKLKAKGYDTSKLEEDLKTLDSKIQKLATDYAAFISKLKETQNLTCGNSEGEYRSKLVEAKALLETVHKDAKDIKSFYVGTIKPDLQSIRQQRKEDKAKSDTSTESTTENSNTQ